MNPRMVVQLILGAVALVAGIGALAHFAGPAITAWCTAVVAQMGLGGLYVIVVLTDPIPGPGFEPALFVGAAGGLGYGPVWAATSAGTVTSSACVWWAGRSLAGNTWLMARLDRWKIPEFLRRHGTRALAVGAVGPFPWSLVMLGASASGVSFQAAMRGAAFRPLKVAALLGLFALGWTP